MEIDCETTNDLFLPILLDNIVTAGITKKLVTKAPTLPKRVSHHQAPSGHRAFSSQLRLHGPNPGQKRHYMARTHDPPPHPHKAA